MKFFFKRMWKALGGILAGVTAVNVDWVTNEIFAADLPHEIDVSIATFIAFLVVYFFPRNKKRDEVKMDTLSDRMSD